MIIRAGADGFKGCQAVGAVTSSEIDRYVDWFAFLLTSQVARERLSNGARILRQACVIVAGQLTAPSAAPRA
jgi:hypothetical protein